MMLLRNALWIVLLILFASAGDGDYLDQLLTQSRTLQLPEAPAWLNLLHCEEGEPTTESRIDDPRFFLAPDGKTNPAAELEATLVAFFRPAMTNEVDHAVCRFYARFTWLDEQLDFDRSQLPVTNCAPAERAFDSLQPEAVTLIYATDYLGNPASMFGHTLLVFEHAKQNRLLSQAVNYAARTPPRDMLRSIKGLTGQFKGYYHILPYYEKVEEYADVSQRDMWEYPMTLAPQEVRRLFLHIWELQEIYSDYWFFGENCSFNLMHLFEVARPGQELTDHFGWYVLPVDTVKAALDAGLLRERVYRPSKASTIRHLESLLSEEERTLARQIADQQVPPTTGTNGTNPRVLLDLAAELVQYDYVTHELSPEAYRPRFLKILRTRSRLGRYPDGAPTPPPPSAPDLGHGAGRLGLQLGARNDTAYLELNARAVYHGTMDPPQGFAEGSHLVFGEIAGRVEPDEGRVSLERLQLVDAGALRRRSTLVRPLSWRMQIGLERPFIEDDDELLGRALFRFGIKQGIADVMLGAAMYTDLTDTFHGGPHLSLGVDLIREQAWRSRLEASAAFLGGERTLVHPEAFWRTRVDLSTNVGLDVLAGWQGEESWSLGVGVLRFF